MSNQESLTTISYVILGVVGEGGAGAHDLALMLRGGSDIFPISPSQIYAEPKRLEQLGLLSVRQEPGKTTPRRVYSLTDRGRKALREWMSQPASLPRLRNEPAVRIMTADIAGPERVLESLRGMRPAIEQALENVARRERGAQALPHRQAYLDLNNWFGRRWCELLLGWLDEAERVLGDAKARPER